MSAGTLTKIGSTTDDGLLWKAAANTYVSTTFTTPIAVTRGVYYLCLQYNTSAQTTAPSINFLPNLASGTQAIPGLTNSHRMTAATTITTLPATQASSGLSSNIATPWVSLYE